MNMYERYAMKDIWFGWQNGHCDTPILIHSKTGHKKNIVTDEIVKSYDVKGDCYGRPIHISYIVADKLRPNQLYTSRIMQDCLKLMEQANWNRDIFGRLWHIVYDNAITTRGEVLHMASEIKAQSHREDMKKKVAQTVSEEVMSNF